MNNINPVNHVVIGKIPTFKASSTKQPEATYNTAPNELNGREAISAYNLGALNFQQKLNIPTIQPLPIETDINKINGEKIYNSKGELLKIVDENNDIKKEYFIKNDVLDFYKQTDKSNSEKIIMHYDDNAKIAFVDKEQPNGISYSTSYDENGNVKVNQKDFFNKDKDLSVSYDSKTEKYYVNAYDHVNNKSTFLEFNKNKMLTNIDTSDRGMANIEFYNNKPYAITVSKMEHKVIPNNLGKDDINLENLEPHAYKEYNLDNIKNLEGEKTYYSNGNFEKVITSDGTEYQIDLDERFFTVKQGNKEIHYEKNIFGEWAQPVVDETFNNGAKKQTRYAKDGSIDVFYTDNNLHKSATYYPNGSLRCYSEEKNGNIKDRNFDENGNLIGVWDGKLDD